MDVTELRCATYVERMHITQDPVQPFVRTVLKEGAGKCFLAYSGIQFAWNYVPVCL